MDFSQFREILKVMLTVCGSGLIGNKSLLELENICFLLSPGKTEIIASDGYCMAHINTAINSFATEETEILISREEVEQIIAKDYSEFTLLCVGNMIMINEMCFRNKAGKYPDCRKIMRHSYETDDKKCLIDPKYFRVISDIVDLFEHKKLSTKFKSQGVRSPMYVTSEIEHEFVTDISIYIMPIK